MRSSLRVIASGVGILLLGSGTLPAAPPPPEPAAAMLVAPEQIEAVRNGAAMAAVAVQGPAEEPPPPPPPPTPKEALQDGVLIVVSLESQQMFVFRDGENWASSKVSTGRRGHETPAGTFPILQKKVHHRSNLYDDAPMPFMQRLTWDGVALHAGRVPGYPASHGCIRMPKAFAEKLYRVTGFSSTIVVVTEEPVTSVEEARAIV